MPRGRYCWSTGGAAVDCAAPWRAGGAELRAGFFAGAGFTVVAVGFVSAGAPAAAGAVNLISIIRLVERRGRAAPDNGPASDIVAAGRPRRKECRTCYREAAMAAAEWKR